MNDSQKLEEIYQAAVKLYTDQTFMNRIISQASQAEQAKIIALGELILDSVSTPTIKEDEQPKKKKIPYEYCETSGQYGY